MKNLLRTSLYFSAFAFAGILFQISCSNSDDSSRSSLSSGKVAYLKSDESGQSIWTCNYDGTNQQMIPITLPSNTEFNLTNGTANPHISPDGEKIFLTLRSTTDGSNSIYSWNIDGSNMQAVVNATPSTFVMLGNVN